MSKFLAVMNMNVKDFLLNFLRRNETEWDEFWRNQLKKNKSGTPKYTVYTDPDSEEEECMSAWIDKWREHFSYFNNTGCGCCINDYEFDAPQEAIDELPDDLIELHLYEERNRPIRTGTQSSFGEFSRSAEKLNHKKGS